MIFNKKLNLVSQEMNFRSEFFGIEKKTKQE